LAGEKRYRFDGETFDAQAMLIYTTNVLKRYNKSWSETMLFTAIQFIIEELGVSKIYYHSFETGRVLKNLKYSCPPRSLYTDLPKQFCFNKVNLGPSFIANNRFAKRRLKKSGEQSWFYLEL